MSLKCYVKPLTVDYILTTNKTSQLPSSRIIEMLRQPTSINAGSIRRCREYKNTATFGDVGDEGYYEDVANFDAHSDELQNARAQQFFNNSVSAFLAMLSSIIFWCIYWMAKALIVAAGIFVIFSFICPHKCIGLFNYLMDQHQVEQTFRDEL